MNRICVDIVGPFEKSTNGNTHILTVYDPFSHWPDAYPIKRQDAQSVIECFKKHIANHSAPAECLSDRGKNFMAKAVREFLEQMGTKKYETTPYKPSSNGSVERFHRYLSAAIHFAVKNNPEKWEDNLDTALFAYRTSPIDGLDITPFEIIYGRRPNLPIDNLLFRENYEKPIDNLEQYMQYMFDNQDSMFRAVQRERQERFNRNKRAAGEHIKNRTYKVGDKVYLAFPKGRFRPPGGFTKLAPRNDGPYTVLESMQDGLVYRVQHDTKGFVHTTSVQRMIPVASMILPSNATDLPLPDRLKQLANSADRCNDISEEKHKELASQQQLREANVEAEKKDEEQSARKSNKEAPQTAIQEEQEDLILEDDTFKSEDDEEEQQPVRKTEPKPVLSAQADSAAAAVTQQSSATNIYAKSYRTGPESRANRRLQRAQRAGQADMTDTLSAAYLSLAPAKSSSSSQSRTALRKELRVKTRQLRTMLYIANARGRVTPREGEDLWVRLGTQQRTLPVRSGCLYT
jgi:hypothetical protein